MTWLNIYCLDELYFDVQSKRPAGQVTFHQIQFDRLLGPEDFLFYDWLVDTEGAIRALELHDDRIAEQLLLTQHGERRRYLKLDPLPQIYFDDVVECRPLGLEAFGGIELFVSPPIGGAIIIRLEDWLKGDQITGLLMRLRL